MRINYVITDPSFFSDLFCGQVSHFNGIVEGFEQIDTEIKTFTIDNKVNVLGYINFYLRILNLLKRGEIVLVRKNIYNVIILNLLLLFIYKKVYLFWEVNGLSTERYVDNPLLYHLHKTSKLLHRILLCRSAGVYVVTEQLKRDLVDGCFAISKDKIVVINNGVSLQNLNRSDLTACKDYKNFNILFFGKFQPYNDFDLIIKYAKLLQDSNDTDVRIYMIGSGIYKNKVTRDLAKNKIQNIVILDPVSLSSIADSEIFRTRTIGLVPLKNINSVKYLSPIKFYDYLMLGIPVLLAKSCSLYGSFNEIATVCKFYDPENLESFSYFINEFRDQSFEDYVEVRHGQFDNVILENGWNRRMLNLKEFIQSNL